MSSKLRGPTRKKHRNSKLGCATCKRRRVKCTETLPECTNCVKHGSRCDYLDYTETQLEEFQKTKKQYAQSEALPRPSLADPDLQLQGLSLGENHRQSEAPLDTENAAGSGDGLAKLGEHDNAYLHNGHPNQRHTGPASYFDRPYTHEHDSAAPRDASIDYTSESDHIFASPARENAGMPDSRWSSLDSVPGVHQYGVTQGFDNLLLEQDHQIIYPVYSFEKSVQSHWSLNSAEPRTDRPDVHKSSGPPSGPAHGHAAESKALPHATERRKGFCVLQPKDMDFDARLAQCVVVFGPLIEQGKADLAQIREVYHVWLGQFMYKAYASSIMFSCLTNLTTNYLITNVFRGRKAGDLAAAVQAKSLRKTLLMHSIEHYAFVIKNLRSLLNTNSDPQLAASVSYILSTMSVYDPEATPSSAICFRNGMFSVLSHSLQVAKLTGTKLPLFLPVHLQLASNLMRTVYLPSYDPAFLAEYETMLGRLGTALGSLQPHEISHRPTFDFIAEVYEDLWKFSRDAIRVHIPAANASLDDIPRQLDILFHMFHKWAKLGPSRLLTVCRSTDPLEKVLNLYFRLFRKSAYALLPQVKFGFLRDFDSPLMLDVFPNSCDASVLYLLDSPEKLCVVPAAYHRILPELKLLSAYAIRLVSFLDTRLKILYKNLVYSPEARRLNPIDNLYEWKDTITNIHETRKEFQEKIGLREKCITSFNNTYIAQAHYPRIIERDALGGSGVPGNVSVGADTSQVDLLSLQPHGLLEKDELPVIA